jgi:hypothetical protein
MWQLLSSVDINKTWFLIPLAITISLVYNASRYELKAKILRRAARLFVMIVGSMALVLLLLYLLSMNL